jgi:hypothetical protein
MIHLKLDLILLKCQYAIFVSIFLFDKDKQGLVVAVKIDRIFVTFALLIQINESAKLHNIGAPEVLLFLAAVFAAVKKHTHLAVAIL